jgi:ABC-type dipeptide/oligopeptide/nickel transport system ATPase subunit
MRLDGPVDFEDNTLYFIIGDSGIGKSTLLNFFTAPFTGDPVKNGDIAFTHPRLRPRPRLVRRGADAPFRIRNSSEPRSGAYFRFVRKHLAYIPQTAGSFHPARPLARQLYKHYSWAAEHPSVQEFKALVEKWGPLAGFNAVSVSDDLRYLRIRDWKTYEGFKRGNDGENSEAVSHTIVDIDRRVSLLQDENLSTGQLQRLLVLSAMIRFEVIDTPVLFGDEFLVNFSFTEGNGVLDNIIRCFSLKNKQNKNGKTGAFIFHDLSYPCIKALRDKGDIQAKIMLLREKGPSKSGGGEKEIIIDVMPNADFWSSGLDKESPFYKFKNSYCMAPLTLHGKGEDWERSPGPPITPPEFKAFRFPGKTETLYDDLYFFIRKNRFMALTGFSGCGKTTFAERLIQSHITDKRAFRYFPSASHECLSMDSHVTVAEDLETMYAFYNRMDDIHEEQNARVIFDHCKRARLFSDDSSLADFHGFLKRQAYDLSGGELQRYWFARLTLLANIAEARRPSLLVFDESISSLDCIIKDDLLRRVIEDLFIKQRVSILFVTHDLRDLGVVYRTFKKYAMTDCFEHYEMFGRKIYRAAGPNYEEYRENALCGAYNEYESIVQEGAAPERLSLKRGI